MGNLEKSVRSSRLITLLVLVIGSFFIFNLSRNIARLLQAEKKVDLAREETEELRLEQEKLLKKKKYLESDEFIEEQARNKLNMTKEGEVIVVLPSDFSQKTGEEEKTQAQNLAVYQKWLRVFNF